MWAVSVADKLVLRRQQRAAGLEPDMETDISVHELLAHFKVPQFADALLSMGVDSVDDLAYLQDGDLDKIGMPLIHRRKLLDAVGGEWRQQPAEPPLQAPKLESSSRRMKYEQFEEVVTQLDHVVDSELQYLLLHWRDRLADFTAVNSLDERAVTAVEALKPYTALRVMGVVGRGNAFVMHGVRRPSAAVLSRCRAAVKGPQQGELPYEEWQRHVEAFASVNNLSDPVRDSIRSLDRAQALRVIGFTTGLRFLLPSDGADGDAEASARVQAALEGTPMESMEPQLPFARPVARAQHLASTARRSRSPVRPHLVRAPPRLPDSDGSLEHVVPSWKKHVESFIDLNGLDEGCALMLRQAPKLQALRVLGLIGRENSFLIRGARNPNAAAAHRLKGASDPKASCELFANLPKLIEDFISVNAFDERGAEALRQLRHEEVLFVMGFSSENSFVFQGAKNPSASLMSRITAARRSLRY